MSRYRHSQQDGDVAISKSLSWLLRHGAEKSGIALTADGYAYWDDMSRLSKFRGISLASVERIVAENAKQRFKLIREEGTGRVMIRANQGHTIRAVDEGKLLTPITPADSAAYPFVVHGTTLDAWQTIKTTGLNKMRRNHIHFAIGLPADAGVISGMRSSSRVLIELDLPKVLAAGNIPMFISSNRVILSPGLDSLGLIPPHFFKAVTDRTTGATLMAPPSKHAASGTAAAAAGGGGGGASARFPAAAAGGAWGAPASQVRAPAASSKVRIDKSNGKAYPRSSFLEFYGTDEGNRRWARSKAPSAGNSSKRLRLNHGPADH